MEREWTIRIDGEEIRVGTDSYRLWLLEGGDIEEEVVLVEWKHSDESYLAQRVIENALSALEGNLNAAERVKNPQQQ